MVSSLEEGPGADGFGPVGLGEGGVLVGPAQDRVSNELLLVDDPAGIERVGPVAVRRRAGPSGIAVDSIGLSLAALTAASVQAVVHARHAGIPVERAFLATIVHLALCLPVLVVALSGSRHPPRSRLETSLGQQAHEVLLPLAAGGLVCLAIWRLVHAAGITEPSLDAVLLTCAIGILSVAAARLAYQAPPRRDGRRVSRVLILGSGVVAERLSGQLAAGGGIEIVGFVDDDPKDRAGCLGPLRDLRLVCEQQEVDHLVVAFSRAPSEEFIEVLRPLQGRIPITVVPRLFDVVPANAGVHSLGSGIPAVSLPSAHLGWMPRFLKRALDVTGAGIGLLLLSPVLLVVALAVRLTSPGPVLLRQTRVGRSGEEFSMVKFRSMVTGPLVAADPGAGRDEHALNSELVRLHGEAATGPFPKLKQDPRVTPVGRVIRRTSIDELPQLLNVLKGDMSLVGPRPFMPDDAAFIGGWALRRYAVRPGITGLWQVSGRNDLTFEEMCRLDHLYVSCWSVGLDLRILVRTLRAVTAGRGAY